MPTIASSATRISHDPDSRSGTRFGEYFKYHGWLAPGVRLFRSISFPAKALWMGLALVIPLLTMLAFLASAAQDQMDVARAERAGLNYVRPLLELIRVGEQRRHAASTGSADLAELQAALAQAFDRVQAQESAQGAGLSTGAAYADLAQRHAALMQAPRAGSADETLAAHVAYVNAAIILAREVADGSQLTLDPDMDTYHLMNVAVLRGPREIESIDRLRSLGGLVLATKELSPQRRDAMATALASRSQFAEDVENSYGAAIAATPEVDQLVDRKAATAASAAFLAAVHGQMQGGAQSGADMSAFLAAGQAASERLAAVNQQLLQRLDTQLQARITRLGTRLMAQLAVASVFIAAAAYLMLSFYKVMMGGLQEVSGHLKQIAQGNLSTAPQPWGHDEAAALMLDLRAMQAMLRQTILRVRHSSVEIVHSSSEIASGALDLSARTEQTAANLEESAASMEQIASTVKNTAEHTQQASTQARNNAEAAAEGGRAMRAVVQTMDDIRDSSARIGEIIGTIDAIAFQTNILALNAAVEAARAGEAGRGFAVVASEVRVLAQRSAAAAREIKVLISSSVEQVETGTAAVRHAGGTIDAIVGSSQRVDELLGAISTSAREQSQGVGQIGQAVNELDRMTQQNAAMVEQTAAAASAMKDQARALSEEVARFRIPEAVSASPAAVAVAVNVADFDFDKAIEAHRQWKVKLRKAIAEREHLDADAICKDDQCPLGKWIHGPGGAQWGGKPNFVELTRQHAQFHQAAGDVARTINAGQLEDAERLIGSGSRFAQLSTEVATLLTKAKRGM